MLDKLIDKFLFFLPFIIGGYYAVKYSKKAQKDIEEFYKKKEQE